jgi:hypothetical protein
MGWKNKYPDEMLRRFLEEDGVTLENWFTTGATYCFIEEGQEYIVMDDDDVRVAVICKYLERLGQVKRTD